MTQSQELGRTEKQAAPARRFNVNMIPGAGWVIKKALAGEAKEKGVTPNERWRRYVDDLVIFANFGQGNHSALMHQIAAGAANKLHSRGFVEAREDAETDQSKPIGMRVFLPGTVRDNEHLQATLAAELAQSAAALCAEIADGYRVTIYPDTRPKYIAAEKGLLTTSAYEALEEAIMEFEDTIGFDPDDADAWPVSPGFIAIMQHQTAKVFGGFGYSAVSGGRFVVFRGAKPDPKDNLWGQSQV